MRARYQCLARPFGHCVTEVFSRPYTCHESRRRAFLGCSLLSLGAGPARVVEQWGRP